MKNGSEKKPVCVITGGSSGMGLATARRMGHKGVALVLAARTPKNSRPGAAYAISKYFVIWYARHEAARFGARGVRVLSVTPGNFDTPMGKLEKDEAGAYLKFNAIPRLGKPDEIAALFAAVSDPEMGYLTGTDILCDGGCVAGKIK